MPDVWEEMVQAERSEQRFAVSATAVNIVSVSDFRVALVVSGGGSIGYILGFGPNVAAGSGVAIPAGGAPVTLTIQDHGRMVRGPIWAISPGGAQTITVWEALHPCPCLRGGS